MKNLIKIISIGTLLLLFLSGCVKKSIEIETISQIRALLPKLTGKVKAGILEGMSSEKELTTFIKNEFPETISRFSKYSIFMKNENNTAVVLLCDKDKKTALLEDSSCTGAVEGFDLYTRELSCKFQLDIDSVCNK